MARDYGIERANFRLENGEINPNCDISIEGYGATMSEINSYIGLEQMKHIENLLEKQRQNALIWDVKILAFKGVSAIRLTANTKPNYWVYGVLCDNKMEVLDGFRKEGWYATGVHINNNLYSVFKNCEQLKGVNEFMNKYLAIPSGWWV